MAGNSTKVNTDQVEQIAGNLENLNRRLTDELKNARNTLNNLSNIWTGEAAQETTSSFNEFADKYFQSYEDIIQQYVQFLRTSVAEGYFNTETQNISLSDAFK